MTKQKSNFLKACFTGLEPVRGSLENNCHILLGEKHWRNKKTLKYVINQKIKTKGLEPLKQKAI